MKNYILILIALILSLTSCQLTKNVSFYSLSFPRLYRSEQLTNDSASNKIYYEYLLFQNDTTICRFYSDQKRSYIRTHYKEYCNDSTEVRCVPIEYDGFSFVIHNKNSEDRYLVIHKTKYLWVDFDRVDDKGRIILSRTDVLYKLLELKYE